MSDIKRPPLADGPFLSPPPPDPDEPKGPRIDSLSTKELWARVKHAGATEEVEVLINRAREEWVSGKDTYLVRSTDGQWFLTPGGMAQAPDKATRFNTNAAAEAARMAYLANCRWDGPTLLVAEV